LPRQLRSLIDAHNSTGKRISTGKGIEMRLHYLISTGKGKPTDSEWRRECLVLIVLQFLGDDVYTDLIIFGGGYGHQDGAMTQDGRKLVEHWRLLGWIVLGG
jgi:hypothetical protein